MPERHVLGGVAYVPVGVATIAHDVWLMGKVHAAGLHDVVVREGEDSDSWAKRFVFEMMASGAALEVLGGIVVPEAVGPAGWTPGVATATALHLGSLAGEEDKEAVFGILLTTVLAFFESGLTSFSRSMRSSTAGDQPATRRH
ncbi:MAG: hypothetical protein A2V88_02640 [Elusimicrobia bacterium RBG_16_66_12]|nr:MAG: hypothetical protein A2V88_02640 [Elusimicrobia bacterium RBG_16_66_12]